MSLVDTKPKVEILDDEVDFSRYICSIARGIGFDAVVPKSAEWFMSNYTADKELILLDLYMPGVDGVELLRFMANNNPPVAIILMSGGDDHVLRSAKKLAHELGLNVIDTIRKPIRKAELEKILHRATTYIGSDIKAVNRDVVPSIEHLRNAIQESSIDVAYQPQVDCEAHSVLGFEALARWHHHELGSISPMVFISMAETSGLIDKLDLLVLQKAIKQLADFHHQDDKLRLSVNMSANTLSNLSLPEMIADLLLMHGISMDKLTIEVTETALMKDRGKSLDILTRLRMKGIHLSIDDFGTGYSSLAQLVRFPFSELKIDRSFVEDMEADPDCLGVVRASIMLAHELGMKTVAEGVSRQELLTLIKDLGCDISQGFFTGRPLDKQQVSELIEKT